MAAERRWATRQDLAGVARAALGGGRHLEDVERLRGGSKKGVYRLLFDDGSTAVAYIWGEAENYWPVAPSDGDLADPFSAASGIGLLEAATLRLEKLGVRTPRILLADNSRIHYPADVAVVEDVPGPNLETRLRDEPRGAEAVMERLAGAIAAMHLHTAPRFGKVALIDSGGTSAGASCEQVVLDRALADLAEAAGRDPRVAAARGGLEAALRDQRATLRPRSACPLIHGELGPGHVLVDREGQPVLIDTEGLMYFDAEWEHVFLRILFRDRYRRHLQADGLDSRRLSFYDLAMRLSLVAGPLRLLDGDYPERGFMAAIAESNLRAALALVPGDGTADTAVLPAGLSAIQPTRRSR